jgi:AraC family transcriptional activator FtrA
MRDQRKVVAVAYDGLGIFEFGIVTEVFALPRPELDVDWYRFKVCSVERQPVRANGGITVSACRGLGTLQTAGTIIIPGWRCAADEPPPSNLVRALRRAHAEGARLVSICSGVFVLAATGLLDGKRATTHWLYLDRLTSRYPNIQVEPDVLYVDEGNILTSAGSAAGIDLCLHIVRRDYGAEIANHVARRMVVSPHRDGGQAQYVPNPIRSSASGGLAAVLEWAQSALGGELLVEDLARKAAMSPRTFARRFRQQTGTTPRQWLIHQRVLAAQRRLETTADSIDQVAERVGLQTAASLRQHFRRVLRTTPTLYRQKFSTLISGARRRGRRGVRN